MDSTEIGKQSFDPQKFRPDLSSAYPRINQAPSIIFHFIPIDIHFYTK